MRRSRTLVVSSVICVAALLTAACSETRAIDITSSNQSPITDPDSETEAETGTSDPDADTVPDTGALPEAAIAWSMCDTDESLLALPLECGTLLVPRDYANPGGDVVEIAVVRLVAGDPANRIGSLVFNPGGPGASGIEFLNSAALLVSNKVSDRFDLVGFDPRGVGASSAVDCDVDWDDHVDLLAEGDDAGWDALVANATTDVENCPTDALELAPFVGTNNAARDLDRLREALGDEQLSYVGFSYGTRLGASYAEQFPDRVRALVLDGAVKPTNDLESLSDEQNAGFDRALENFAAACDGDGDCILRDVGPTLDVFTGLQAEIRSVGTFETDEPGRVLTPGELDLGVLSALYSTTLWPFLAQALYVADVNADGTLLQILADNYLGRESDGTYANVQEANAFINCADDPVRRTVEELRVEAEQAAGSSTYFSDLNRADTGCLGIDEAIDPLVLGPATGAPPILVIGNTGDPATPYEWAVELAAFLDSAVLYSVDAEGHTAYLSIDCATPVVEAYLLGGDLPVEGSSCSDNADADFFLPAGESEADQIVAFMTCLGTEGVDVGEITLADVLADPTGEELFGGLDLNDPDTVGALIACQDLLPQ